MKILITSFPRIPFTIGILLVTGILFSSCNKEEPIVEEPDTSDYLPNLANSFDALVNGVPFNETLFISEDLNGRITLTASRDNGMNYMRLFFPSDIVKGTYSLEGANSEYRGFYVANMLPGEQYSTAINNGSIVTITGHDTNNDVLTGTFSMKPFTDTNTVSPNEFITITAGEFTINY